MYHTKFGAVERQAAPCSPSELLVVQLVKLLHPPHTVMTIIINVMAMHKLQTLLFCPPEIKEKPVGKSKLQMRRLNFRIF